MGGLALILVSCTKLPSTGAPAEVPPAPKLAFNSDEFTKLASRIDALETSERSRKLLETFDREAYLSPSKPEYQSVKMDIGYVLVSVDNVNDYANGSKIVLNFGNPTGANISNISADIEWGQNDASGTPIGEVHSMHHDFTDNLPAASWHKMEVNLSDVPPKLLGYVRIKNLEHKTVFMRNSN